MDDAGIRALLRAQVKWGVRPGARVVTHEAVAEAGADVESVDRYIIARGGQRIHPSHRGHLNAADPASQPYWLVPHELLTTN